MALVSMVTLEACPFVRMNRAFEHVRPCEWSEDLAADRATAARPFPSDPWTGTGGAQPNAGRRGDVPHEGHGRAGARSKR